MIGNYAGVACGYTTPLQGIGKYSKTIHQQGCSNVACKVDTLFGAAIDAARHADATILVMGLDQSIEAEFRDRVGLLLPGRQQELISKVSASSKGPTILVLMSGGPVDVSFAKNDPRIAGIVWAGYPGQSGGQAIADIVFLFWPTSSAGVERRKRAPVPPHRQGITSKISRSPVNRYSLLERAEQQRESKYESRWALRSKARCT
ncbi:hypothetical protein ACLB2K_053702 [Fragaria x ananassa]